MDEGQVDSVVKEVIGLLRNEAKVI
jgi:hypothetical protein